MPVLYVCNNIFMEVGSHCFQEHTLILHNHILLMSYTFPFDRVAFKVFPLKEHTQLNKKDL